MTVRLATLCLFLLAAAFAAQAHDETPKDHPSIAAIVKGGGCAPKDNMARVLKSANPLDNAPDWTGNNYIGTGWTFMPKRYVVTELSGGIFLVGNLVTTRGAPMPDDLFILYAEWDCGR
jgi:hypothetical protein